MDLLKCLPRTYRLKTLMDQIEKRRHSRPLKGVLHAICNFRVHLRSWQDEVFPVERLKTDVDLDWGFVLLLAGLLCVLVLAAQLL